MFVTSQKELNFWRETRVQWVLTDKEAFSLGFIYSFEKNIM